MFAIRALISQDILPAPAKVEHVPLSPPAGAAIVLHSPLTSHIPAITLHLFPAGQPASLVHFEDCGRHIPFSLPYALLQNPLWHLNGELQAILFPDWHIPNDPHLSLAGHLAIPSAVHDAQCPGPPDVGMQTPVAHSWPLAHSAPLIFICLCVGTHVLPTHSFPAPHSVFVEHLVASTQEPLPEAWHSPLSHTPELILHLFPAEQSESLLHLVLQMPAFVSLGNLLQKPLLQFTLS